MEKYIKITLVYEGKEYDIAVPIYLKVKEVVSIFSSYYGIKLNSKIVLREVYTGIVLLELDTFENSQINDGSIFKIGG